MVMVFPLEKLVYGFSPLGESVGLHDYSPLGERMGCMITPHWGRGLDDYGLPAGEVGLWLLPAGGKGWR